jgi:hypothetical protein
MPSSQSNAAAADTKQGGGAPPSKKETDAPGGGEKRIADGDQDVGHTEKEHRGQESHSGGWGHWIYGWMGPLSQLFVTGVTMILGAVCSWLICAVLFPEYGLGLISGNTGRRPKDSANENADTLATRRGETQGLTIQGGMVRFLVNVGQLSLDVLAPLYYGWRPSTECVAESKARARSKARIKSLRARRQDCGGGSGTGALPGAEIPNLNTEAWQFCESVRRGVRWAVLSLEHAPQLNCGGPRFVNENDSFFAGCIYPESSRTLEADYYREIQQNSWLCRDLGRFSVSAYAPLVFRAVRNILGVSQFDVAIALETALFLRGSPGKSGSLFMETQDGVSATRIHIGYFGFLKSNQF